MAEIENEIYWLPMIYIVIIVLQNNGSSILDEIC